MANQVTVTAKTGPAVQATATVLTNVNNMNFDLKGMVVQVFREGKQYKEFDLYGVTTVTFTISGSTYTMVIS